jgi:glycerol-3-phosphate acyltransferase PlsX
LDYSDYGGAPLLGINGVCIIGHGRSNGRAVASAIMAAKEAVARSMVAAIRDSITSEGEPLLEAKAGPG